MKARKKAFWTPGAAALAVLAFAAFFSSCPTTGKAAGTVPDAAAEPGPVTAAEAASLMEAVHESYGELTGNIHGSVSVAVISIASADPAEGEFAVEELILFLVNSKKYSVVDRRSLDLIRAEQHFQLSGEVDDDTAVSIGHLTGAAIVITGTITPYDTAKYLRLKALDVETGEIRAVSSRRYGVVQ